MEPTEFKFPRFDRRIYAIGGLLFLIVATAFVGARTMRNYAEPAREFDWENRGMSDFYTLYYYSHAFCDGVNPYSSQIMEQPEYLVPRNAAPFSPFVFLAYVPLTVLSVKAAGVVFFAINWLMLGVLAWCCIVMSRLRFDWILWLWVFGLLVFSRPGHMSLFTGYFTVEIALGMVTALHFSKSKPWLSGLGFLFASIKPTYAIPLTLLMLARRDFKAVAIGVGLSSVLALGCFAWLASHSSFAEVIEGIQSGQQAFHDDPTEAPVNTWTRIDVAGMAAKIMQRAPGTAEYLMTMMALLVVPCLTLWKVSAKEIQSASNSIRGAGGLSALIVVLSLLVTIYHHSYDCVVMAVSVCALLLGSQALFGWSRLKSTFVGALLLLPMLNYASTHAIKNLLGFEQSDMLWQLITLINGMCLAVALLLAISHGLKKETAIQQDNDLG